MPATLDDYLDACPDLQRTSDGFRGTCPCCGLEGFRITVYDKASARLLGMDLETYCPNGCKPKETQRALSDLALAGHRNGKTPVLEEIASRQRVGEIGRRLEEAPSKPPEPLKILSLAEVRALPPPVWQVDNFFQEESFVQIFGQSNHCKSLFTLDLGLSNAKGSSEWFGRRIYRPGPVFWVNADGGRGITPRINAWMAAHGEEMQYSFHTLMGSVSLGKLDEVKRLEEAIHRMDPLPTLIVFDTLSRCIPGVDENHQGEMTKVTQSIHHLRLSTKATIVVLHHTDKTGQWERGSSVIRGEVDTQIRVTKEEQSKTICVSSKKSREGDQFEDFYFSLLPMNESVVVVKCEAPETSVEPESGIDKVRKCIEESPMATRDYIALFLNMPLTTVKLHVGNLIDAADVVEIPSPRQQGKTGKVPMGLLLKSVAPTDDSPSLFDDTPGASG